MNEQKNVAEFVLWWFKSGGPRNDRTAFIPIYIVLATLVIGVSFAIHVIIGIVMVMLLVVPPVALLFYVVYKYFQRSYAEFIAK